jgi:hypothetical protein
MVPGNTHRLVKPEAQAFPLHELFSPVLIVRPIPPKRTGRLVAVVRDLNRHRPFGPLCAI